MTAERKKRHEKDFKLLEKTNGIGSHKRGDEEDIDCTKRSIRTDIDQKVERDTVMELSQGRKRTGPWLSETLCHDKKKSSNAGPAHEFNPGLTRL